ncbi:hypothetical protein LMG27174_06221 [Paraburkholderia rhynchosiae]|uniref:HTH tetR-type domain-containing protein n=2 Tax=Paraburkholderia rhynchosiae TaxID=487049 RepID=A0A2N7W551_9BURK|nr:hypothetical protein C0Z16_30950 [Paraburkholderia rhynchosiae]CAB3735615.1 hypothetical protein LMG27174_06221 [Paraburkholderia rhynchosiae]
MSAAARRRTGRPSQSLTGELHEHYLDVALGMFLAHGYEGASIEAIATAAQAGKTSFYRRFGNKEELFKEVVRREIADVRLALYADEFRSGGGGRQRLANLVHRCHELVTAPGYVAVLRVVVAELPRFPELAQYWQTHSDDFRASLAVLLKQATEEGWLCVPAPEIAALGLACLAFGGSLPLSRGTELDENERNAWLESVTELLWRAWRPLAR